MKNKENGTQFQENRKSTETNLSRSMDIIKCEE